MHCPSCNQDSRSFEAFSVMHLGIPPPTKRSIELTCIDVRGQKALEKIMIEVSLNGSIKDLYDKVAATVGMSENQPWTAMSLVLNRTPFTFPHTTMSVSCIESVPVPLTVH